MFGILIGAKFQIVLRKSNMRNIYEILIHFIAILKERKKEFEEEDLWDTNWNVCDDNGRVKWNPIKMIKKYTGIGDSFGTINLPYEFYAKIIRKHPYAINDYLTKEEWNFMHKGLEVYAKYSTPFYNKNWGYTWYEWFVIISTSRNELQRSSKDVSTLGDGRKPPL